MKKTTIFILLGISIVLTGCIKNNTERTDEISETEKSLTQIQWIWEDLGCGSHAPCSYRVCPKIDSGDCYSCTGKYDFTSPQGEKTPNFNTDPRTTTDFTCKADKTIPDL